VTLPTSKGANDVDINQRCRVSSSRSPVMVLSLKKTVDVT
jgi:hypothetical protein